jgi:hypothetical protein
MPREELRRNPMAHHHASLAGLQLGSPPRSGPLRVIRVYARAPKSHLSYDFLGDGIRSGDAAIREQPDATIPTLSVTRYPSLRRQKVEHVTSAFEHVLDPLPHAHG